MVLRLVRGPRQEQVHHPLRQLAGRGRRSKKGVDCSFPVSKEMALLIEEEEEWEKNDGLYLPRRIVNYEDDNSDGGELVCRIR